MEQEKLNKGVGLQMEIVKYRKLLDDWNKAENFFNGNVEVTANGVMFYIQPSQHTFEVVKAINVTHYTKIVSDLENELKAL